MFRPIITDNIIENNGQDGINASTLYFAQLQGTWSNNTIESNGRDGIRFTDGDESGPSFNITVANNMIENNLADGIFYTSVETIPLGGGNGTVDITDNLIKKNGGNGVDVQITGSAVANINLTDNQIIFNTLDGVNMVANSSPRSPRLRAETRSPTTAPTAGNSPRRPGSDSNIFLGNGLIDATLTDNIISFNGARGIDILNQWNGQMNIDIEGTVNPTLPANIGNPANDSNIVDANGQQGIFVENAADLSLSQQSPLNYFQVSTTAPTIVAPILQLTVNQTEISGNGTNAALVNATPDAGDGILINVGTSQFGYVNASITNNHFSGNANIDFVTQSFVSTAQPSITNFYNASNFTHQPGVPARSAGPAGLGPNRKRRQQRRRDPHGRLLRRHFAVRRISRRRSRARGMASITTGIRSTLHTRDCRRRAPPQCPARARRDQCGRRRDRRRRLDHRRLLVDTGRELPARPPQIL